MAALFRRDLAVARSYRAAFFLELFETLFAAAGFYFLSRFIESPQLERALPPGTSYFSFALVGLAFFDYLSVALRAFDEGLQDARQNGTLEHLLVTQTSLPVILAGSILYPFVLLSLRTAIYLGWGAALFGFPLGAANWLGAFLVLAASILAFSGLGVLSASYLLVFKRGSPMNWALVGISSVVSGMMYPVSVLPAWLQYLAWTLPPTYVFEGMRALLIDHVFRADLMVWSLAINALLFIASFAIFLALLRSAKHHGSLLGGGE